jgi:hypothetical protein
VLSAPPSRIGYNSTTENYDFSLPSLLFLGCLTHLFLLRNGPYPAYAWKRCICLTHYWAQICIFKCMPFFSETLLQFLVYFIYMVLMLSLVKIALFRGVMCYESETRMLIQRLISLIEIKKTFMQPMNVKLSKWEVRDCMKQKKIHMNFPVNRKINAVSNSTEISILGS